MSPELLGHSLFCVGKLLEFTIGSVWPFCPFFPLRKMGGRFVFKTHLDIELGCMWIAQLQELVPVLGSVARFSNVKASPSHH